MQLNRSCIALMVVWTLGGAAAHGQTCDAVPRTGCKQSTVGDKALLLLKDKGGKANSMVWKWIKGEATTPAELGTPEGATGYTLCIYDASGGLPVLASTSFVPAGGTCDGAPCWKAIGKGFKYKDSTLSNDGIKGVLLKFGDAGKAKIVVKAKGAGFEMPALPLQQDEQVVVQLSNQDGTCWEARYSAPTVKNEDGQFKDKGDAPIAAPTPTSTVGVPGSTPTSTAVFTFTPTPGGGNCGNRVLEPGETCAGCPADCVIGPCTAVAPTIAFAVDLLPPIGEQPTSATVLLGYNSTRASIPGSGNAVSVRQRVLPPAPLPQAFAVNDLDYAVRVVISRNVPLGHLVTATFDRCSGQPAPALADLACTVEGCASGGAPVEGCACSVRIP